MNSFISLKDYGDFANSIGFVSTKNKAGVFIYKNKEINTELLPYELGNLFRICNLKYAEGIQDSLNTLEFYLKQSKTTKELQNNLHEFINEMKQTHKICENKFKNN